MTPTPGAALTATHWMSDGIHGYASNVWAATAMPVTSGFANANILMIQVSDLANSGPALQANHAQLTGG